MTAISLKCLCKQRNARTNRMPCQDPRAHRPSAPVRRTPEKIGGTCGAFLRLFSQRSPGSVADGARENRKQPSALRPDGCFFPGYGNHRLCRWRYPVKSFLFKHRVKRAANKQSGKSVHAQRQSISALFGRRSSRCKRKHP